MISITMVEIEHKNKLFESVSKYKKKYRLEQVALSRLKINLDGVYLV